jgi:hypothetical protein
VITDTGWIDTGITYQNGFGREAGDPMAYRITNLGKFTLVWLKGNAGSSTGSAVTLNQGIKTAAMKFPTAVSKYLNSPYHISSTVGGRYILDFNGITIRQDLDATGTLYFTARSGVSKATFFVDSVYVVGAEVTS